MLISVPHLATPFKVILYTPLVKADQSGKKKSFIFWETLMVIPWVFYCQSSLSLTLFA